MSEFLSVFPICINTKKMQRIVSGKMCSKTLLAVKKFYREKTLKSLEVLHNLGINRKLPL